MARVYCRWDDIREALDQAEFMFDLPSLLLALVFGLLKLGFIGVFFECYLKIIETRISIGLGVDLESARLVQMVEDWRTRRVRQGGLA